MTRVPLHVAALALVLAGAPALGQQAAKRAQDRGAQDRGAAPPVIGCPSLANYRLLMRAGAPAAASVLADAKADHLGCAALARGRITGIADRVALGGQSYDCASVQGTSACHWMEAGAVPVASAAARGVPGR